MEQQQLSVDEYEAIKRLAVLDMEGDARAHTAQLGKLLNHFSMVQRYEPPAGTPRIPRRAVTLREDVVAPSMERSQLLKLAPDTEGHFIKVPPVA